MATIEESKRNIYKYNDIIDKLNVIISNLEKCKETNDKMLMTISQEYLVDGENPAIYNRIANSSENVNKTSNYLKNTIIPAVKYMIQKEKNNIYALENANING